MSNEDPQASTTGTVRSRGLVLVGALIAVGVVGAALLIASRGDEPTSTSTSIASATPETTSPIATSIPDSRSTVVARLREILQVRERAFETRDSSLFDEVYTDNCSCLRAGRNAIAALRKEKVVWKDRSISIEIRSAERVNSDLWEIVATFNSDAFRIESENGALIREAPAERLQYRFLLVRQSDTDNWLLGSATLVEG